MNRIIFIIVSFALFALVLITPLSARTEAPFVIIIIGIIAFSSLFMAVFCIILNFVGYRRTPSFLIVCIVAPYIISFVVGLLYKVWSLNHLNNLKVLRSPVGIDEILHGALDFPYLFLGFLIAVPTVFVWYVLTSQNSFSQRALRLMGSKIVLAAVVVAVATITTARVQRHLDFIACIKSSKSGGGWKWNGEAGICEPW